MFITVAGEKKEVKEAISTYCQMDTYAEYIVYHGLIEDCLQR